MRRPAAALLATLALLLGGCADGQQDRRDAAPPAGASAPAGGAALPVYDASTDMWLLDGWPVPDPAATFDPSAPYLLPQEIADLIQACMQVKGWDLKPEPGSGFSGYVPPEQRDAYQGDLMACHVENRIGIDPAPPINADLAKKEFAAQVATRECLSALGLAVPDLPSYAIYEEDLLVHGIPTSIYTLSADAGVELLAQPSIESACPDPMETWGRN